MNFIDRAENLETSPELLEAIAKLVIFHRGRDKIPDDVAQGIDRSIQGSFTTVPEHEQKKRGAQGQVKRV